MREPSYPTVVGDEVTVGHGAILHGCTIEDRCLIGMGAILLNGSPIGSDSIVAAGTLVTEGTVIPPRSLVMGSPGKVKRALTDGGARGDSRGRGQLRRATGSITWIRTRSDRQWPQPRPSPRAGCATSCPDDVRRREYVIGVIADVYQRYGFEPLETPAVENIETLLGKYGEEGDRLIFKILKRGEEGRQTGEADLALRYDLTVPLARVVAEYRGKLPKFFKRYQVQPVWRADRPQKGRFREFYQCDVDVVGSTSLVVEAELCAAVSDVLARLGFQRLRDPPESPAGADGAARRGRRVPPELHGTALVALDKLDKIGARRRGGGTRGARRRRRPPAAAGVSDGCASTSTRSPTGSTRCCDADASLRQTRARESAVGAGAATDSQREIVRLSQGTTSPAPHLRIDPSLARGLSYYTGAIMEIAVPDLAGSLGGGGRYDNLVGHVLGRAGAGVRVLARSRADPRRDGRARDVPGDADHRSGRRARHALESRAHARRARAGRIASQRAACASTCIRRPTSSGSSSSTPPPAASRSSSSWATTRRRGVK